MTDVLHNGKRYRTLKPHVQKPRIEIYQEHGAGIARERQSGNVTSPGWRWRLLGRNGKILADSGESYTRKADVKRALGIVLEACSLRDLRVDECL